MKRNRGFTLAETMVATGVLSLFIVLAFGAIVPSFKITRQAEQNLAAQREVILAFDRLTAEMSRLDRASVMAVPDALTFLSDQEYRGTNPAVPDADLAPVGYTSPDLVWQKLVILRRRGTNLYRRELPYTKGAEIFQVVPASLPTLADSGSYTEKIFAKNVEYFEADTAGRSRVLMQIRSVYRKGKKPVSCELDLQIQMRGGN
jgi:prepilin-type N-terminal cleavage/methylation domain-containing protein